MLVYQTSTGIDGTKQKYIITSTCAYNFVHIAMIYNDMQ